MNIPLLPTGPQLSLPDIEQRLRRELTNVVLIGELPITPEVVTDLADAIRGLVTRQGIAEATRILSRQYPCTLAVYLVAQGIYGYQGGNYWPQLVETMGSDAVHEWGALFRSFLQQHGLPTFQDLGGHVNLTPILMHGGIPDYSLPDFFQHVLEPLSDALANSDIDIEESILETLAELARRAPADRPIERFLAHGGAFARDFVARSVELTRTFRERGVAPDPAEVGLPARVVTRYAQWAATHAQRRSGPTWRPRRPELWFDPWSDGLLLDLPAQQLPEGSRPEARWRIEVGHITRSRKVSASSTGSAWETMPDRLAVGPSESGYTIAFQDGRGNTCPWTIAAWQKALPAMAFDSETGSYLYTPRGLPARTLWLLVRHTEKLAVNGGQCASILPPLTDEWSQYRLEHWDLSQAQSVEIGGQSVPVLPDENAFRPQLLGGTVVDLGLRSVEIPIYQGQSPELSIPIPPQRNAQQELTRWKLSLTTNDVPILQQVPLVDIRRAVEIQADSLRINLARLTTTTLGRYAITLRGPLGRDSSFHFGLVPRIAISGHYQVRVADETGTLPPGVLRIAVDPALDIVSTDQKLQITPEANGSFTVVAPAELTLARLTLQRRDNRRQELPLTLPLPLLHWALSGSEDGWSTGPIRCPQAWLEQLDVPELQVRLEPPLQLSTPPQIALVISDSAGHLSQRLRPKGDIRRGWNFMLREALDTIRSSDEALLTGRLEIDNLIGQQYPLIVSMLRIEQELGGSRLHVAVLERSGNWSMKVTWEQGRRLRGRSILFWPLWRPWEAPSKLPIPDEITNSYEMHLLRADLPPGRYRVEIAIIDPWSSVERLRPAVEDRGIIDLTVGERAARAVATVTHDIYGALTSLLAAPDTETATQAMRRLVKVTVEPTTADDLLQALAVFGEDLAHITWLQELPRQASEGLRTLARRVGVELLQAILQSPERFRQETWAVIKTFLILLHPEVASVVSAAQRTGMVPTEDIEQIIDLAEATATARKDLLAWLDDQGILLIERGQDAHDQSSGELATQVPPIPEGLLRDSYGCYLYQIGQIPLLKEDEEQHLARLAVEGMQAEEQLRATTHSLRRTSVLRQAITAGTEARNHLISANLRLVVSMTKRYRGRGLDDLDLVQEGNVGLMRAVEKFDSTKGFRFTTYATWWIKQSLSRAVADQGRLVRLPVHLHEQISKLYVVQRQLSQQLRREPGERELAGALGWSERKVIALLGFSQEHISLETPVGEEGDATLGSLIPDPSSEDLASSILNDISSAELKEDISEALTGLTERQQRVLGLRYGLYDGRERTLEEVGRSFGVTRERIRQIEVKSLKQLNHPRIAKKLRPYISLAGESKARDPLRDEPQLN